MSHEQSNEEMDMSGAIELPDSKTLDEWTARKQAETAARELLIAQEQEKGPRIELPSSKELDEFTATIQAKTAASEAQALKEQGEGLDIGLKAPIKATEADLEGIELMEPRGAELKPEFEEKLVAISPAEAGFTGSQETQEEASISLDSSLVLEKAKKYGVKTMNDFLNLPDGIKGPILEEVSKEHPVK